MPFSQLKLSDPILKAISIEGYDKPSPIQAQAILPILEGRDIMAAAQTGTGKTAAFTWPMLEKLSIGERAKPNQVRALVITPTRELAAQVGASIATYGNFMDLRYSVVFGGVKINPQMMALRKGVDILVATPGRLLDLYQQNAVGFKQLEILVLDEADRMLDMGFINDIKKILSLLPKQRQNLMFSATFSDDIRNLAKGLMNNPIEISVSPRNTTVESVSQYLVPVDKKQKTGLLIHLLNENRWPQVLVFTRTKHGANKLTRDLEKEKINAAAIHGNKSQGARTKALADFKNNKVQVLVATDIAARGIDIDLLPFVVNFDLPNVPEDYVHRIGRTGRAGASGQAVSLVSADEFKQLSDIERVIKQLIPRKLIDGFEPSHDLPASRLNSKPVPAQKSAHKPAHKPARIKTTSYSGQKPSSRAPQGRSRTRSDNSRSNNHRNDSTKADQNSGNRNRNESNRSDNHRKPDFQQTKNNSGQRTSGSASTTNRSSKPASRGNSSANSSSRNNQSRNSSSRTENARSYADKISYQKSSATKNDSAKSTSAGNKTSKGKFAGFKGLFKK